jgi:hypothetical protein
MTLIADLFNPEILLSKKNPFLKASEKTHRLIFESFDRTARLQLAFTKDLLDLNHRRFNALYADDTLRDRISTHQDLATEMGKRTAIWAGDLQEVAVELQSGFGEAANELFFSASGKAAAPGKKSAKKAKAA